jgi:uncharacterized membrane protein YraQ (UPF0718 family)
MIKYIKNNKLLVLSIISLIGLFIYSPVKGEIASMNALDNFASVGKVLPPIFILIGLMDVWVPKEVMVKYMGKDSGLLGVLLSVLLGAVGAGPLVVAFPIAALLIRKGARFSNVFLFLGAWTSVKLPIFMFEWINFGGKFTLIHVITSMLVYFISGFIIEKLLTEKNVGYIVNRAEELG